MVTDVWTLSSLVAVAIAAHLLYRLHHRRFREYAQIPQPKTSFIWGHLKFANECLMKGDPRRHADYIFRDMIESVGNPGIMVADFWPVNGTLGIVQSHVIAEQIARPSRQFPYSVAKIASSVPDNTFRFIFGDKSMLRVEGEEWKALRKRFNPGFSIHNIIKMLPRILDKTDIFMARLDAHAASGQTFSMAEFCTGLTFDIIGAVVMDMDFDAQKPLSEQSQFIKNYQRLINTFEREDENMVWEAIKSLWPRERASLSQKVVDELRGFVRQKFAEERASDKSILTLSFQDSDVLDDALMEEVVDQIRSFLFAGHDTTSILLQWAFYELTRSPKALSNLREEIDAVFGAEASDEQIRKMFVDHGDQIMGKLPYTSAIIKETLRLYPPAGSPRRVLPGTGFKVTDRDGSQTIIDGLQIYICHFLVHRDEKVYGSTKDDFVPERWLGNTDTFMQTNESWDADNKSSAATRGGQSIPPSAWRPFERGPRNCIGQELANVEARVILVRALRRFDFTKVGLGALALDAKGRPMINEKGQYKVKSELFNTRKITARPVDDTIMKVRLRSPSS